MQIDAHIDTWDEYFGGKYFHGTPFRRAIEEGLVDPRRFVQVGIRGPIYGEDDFAFQNERGVTVVDIERAAREGVERTVELVRRTLGSGQSYLTFDIDAVDPAFAPGTGTPEVGGLTSHEAQRLVRGLAGARSRRRRRGRGVAAVRRPGADHGAARREPAVRDPVRDRAEQGHPSDLIVPRERVMIPARAPDGALETRSRHSSEAQRGSANATIASPVLVPARSWPPAAITTICRLSGRSR